MCNMAATTWCLYCRYPGLGPGGPPQGAALHQFGLFPTPTGPSQAALGQLERERFERLGEHICYPYKSRCPLFLFTEMICIFLPFITAHNIHLSVFWMCFGVFWQMIVTSISEERATSSSVCTLKMGPACSTELLLLFTRLQGVTSQKTAVVSFSWFVILGNHPNPIVCCLDDQLIRHVRKIFKCSC